MRKTLRSTARQNLALASILCLAAPVAVADEYGDARADLVAAYQASEFDAMQAAAERALAARPGYPGALFNLAPAQSLNDSAYASMATLDRLARLGIDFGVRSMDEFEAVRMTPGWGDYWARMEALRKPVGTASVAYRYDVGDFVPEGIAIDRDGTLFLGSIRTGDIVRIEPAGSGAAATLVSAADAGHWSVYGMRLVGETLWYLSSAVDQFEGLDDADAGKNALFALDLATGEATRQAVLPATDGRQVLGDLVFDDDGVLYLADQTDGVVYRYDPASPGFVPVTERGALKSPQGIVVAGESLLYVADYIGGLYRVDVESGAATRFAAPDDTSLYGIDGLYAYGDSLIAIQNGIRPDRVVQLDLSDDGRSIVDSRILAMNLEHFDEPNLGQVVGDQFYFIANSHWNRFDQDGNLPDGLEGPVVLRVDLDNRQSVAEHD